MKAAGMSRWPAYEARLEKAMAAGGDARHQAVSLIHRYLMTADWEQGERALALEDPSYLADLAIKRGYNLEQTREFFERWDAIVKQEHGNKRGINKLKNYAYSRNEALRIAKENSIDYNIFGDEVDDSMQVPSSYDE